MKSEKKEREKIKAKEIQPKRRKKEKKLDTKKRKMGDRCDVIFRLITC